VNRPQNQKTIAVGKSSFDFIDQERLFRELDIKENTILLDAACGCGDYALAAAARIGNKGRIFAFDLWEAGIDRLIDKIVADGITNIVPRVADLCSLPLGNGTIDICLMATVFHDLVQQGTDQGALSEIKRVLKPGGVLAVIEFKKISGQHSPPMEIRLSPEELEGLVTPHGFRIMKTVEIGPYNYLTIFQ